MLIRNAEKKDAAQIVHLRKEIVKTDRSFMITLGEFDLTPEKQIIQMKEIVKNGGLFLLAEQNGHITGFLFFKRNKLQRLAHTGTFSIGVSETTRGSGIGTALLNELIQWAKGQNGLEKIYLGVFAINPTAIHLYEKLGFKEEGRQTDQVKFADGSYTDDVLMALRI